MTHSPCFHIKYDDSGLTATDIHGTNYSVNDNQLISCWDGSSLTLEGLRIEFSLNRNALNKKVWIDVIGNEMYWNQNRAPPDRIVLFLTVFGD